MQNQNNPMLITAQGRRVTDVADNTSDKIIAITESKLRLAYKKFFSAPKKESIGLWSGLAFTCFVAAATSEPKDVLDIPGSGAFIHFGFWVGAVVFSVLFIIAAAKYKASKQNFSEDAFIKELCPDD